MHIVATPIGNLGDVTLRALDILASVDVIACEDTRITTRLLTRYGITTPLTLYHEHNAVRSGPKLIRRLNEGAAIALVSDAGTPLISDPGFKLVSQAHAAEIPVFVAPGASAPIAALVSSGLPTDRFLFAGFLPSRQSARRKALTDIVGIRASLVFLESPRRLARSLADMEAVLGQREAAVARELTKHYEEVVRGSLTELAARYASAATPKGEAVIVVGPPDENAKVVMGEAVIVVGPPDENAKVVMGEEEFDAELRHALAVMSVRDAARAVSTATGRPRREAYRRALALSKSAQT